MGSFTGTCAGGPLGPQSDAIDANATMWAFFQAHPLPA